MMKRWGQILSCVCGFSLVSVGSGRAQAVKDPFLVGSYVGYLAAHTFTIPPTFHVAGALFAFNMQYQQLGYHEGGVRGGVMFMNGRKFVISGSAVVPPFPTPKNQSASFYLECRTVNSIADYLIRWYVTVLDAPFGRQPSDWFGEPADYRLTVDHANMILEYNAGGIVPQEADGDALFEAKKITNLTSGNVRRRIKIRR